MKNNPMLNNDQSQMKNMMKNNLWLNNDQSQIVISNDEYDEK